MCSQQRAYVCMCVCVGEYVSEQSLTVVDGCWLAKLLGSFVLFRRGYNCSLFSVQHLFEVSHSIYVLTVSLCLLSSLWYPHSPSTLGVRPLRCNYVAAYRYTLHEADLDTKSGDSLTKKFAWWRLWHFESVFYQITVISGSDGPN